MYVEYSIRYAGAGNGMALSDSFVVSLYKNIIKNNGMNERMFYTYIR